MNPIVSETDSAVEEPTATTKATPVRARRAPKDDTPRRKQATKNGGSPTPSRRRVRVAEGIYKDRHGLAATVKVNGVQREIRFPPGTPLKTIRARRGRAACESTHAAGRRAAHRGPRCGPVSPAGQRRTREHRGPPVSPRPVDGALRGTSARWRSRSTPPPSTISCASGARHGRPRPATIGGTR